ncbi:DNA repair protein RadA, partial [Candidatus Saccharibacteria bacterium]|nr:DNA repair protein RadA [Candidatus Saccharibacteria bacterium]
MAKHSAKYVCGNCGAQSAAWAGRCSQCGEWNTLQEEVQLVSTASARAG